MITYNHERYIARALESVFAQKTARAVEVIVSEDRSTDRTYDIVREQVAGRDDVRVIRSEANVASNAVVSRAIEAATGLYICLLDGDDYWTCDDKLERQAAILDARPELSAAFHNAAVVDGEGRTTADRWTRADQPALCDLAMLWEGNPFATCAGMLRREALAGLGAGYDGFFPITDWPLYMLCARQGPIAFVDEPVGAYRLHTQGQFSALADAGKLDRIEGFYERMAEVMPDQRAAARAGRTRYFFDWAVALEQEQQYGRALDCLRRAWKAGGVGSSVSSARFVRMAWRLVSQRRSWKAAA